MADDVTRNHGKRWYDPNKIVWGLFGLVGIMVFGFGDYLWARVNSLDEADRHHERQIDLIVNDNSHRDAQMHEMKEQLNRMEGKIDRIADR